MNFFEAQDRAKRATRWLVVGYALATLLIVIGVTVVVGIALLSVSDPGLGSEYVLARHGPLLAATAVGATLFILGASVVRTASLSAGGSKVAASAGGTLVPADVVDPRRRRLRNVVEEIAIASGVPVPEIYVLEAENGINAFAAGYAPGDAAVAVTRGALDLLDRDELQGVIAHEFSHILNGDMRLNIRLMGVLFGIMVLGLVGRMIVRGSYHSSIVTSRRDRNTPVILIAGLGLAIIGAIGVFFARIIKASVSRQRESLADASAVQFTRQTRGIANALKKIGGYSEHSYLRATDPEEISHMLFGSGAKLAGLFATHPPLVERIRALEPGFEPRDFPQVNPASTRTGLTDAAPAPVAGFAQGGTAPAAGDIVASVGNPGSEHFVYAGELRQSIPAVLYDAAHSVDLAYLLAVALVLENRDVALRNRQLQLVEDRLGTARRRLVDTYVDALATAGPRYRLPLLEVAFPALKKRPREALVFLLDLSRRLIEIDGVVNLYEYCYYRILTCNLDQATDPDRRVRRRAGETALRAAQLDLLAVLAAFGQRATDAREAAYAAGAAVLGEWAEGFAMPEIAKATVATLDTSLDTLLGLDTRARRRLLEAVTATAMFDGHLALSEAELVRVVCASLDCPLPPILGTTVPADEARGELAYHDRPRSADNE